MDRVVKDVVAPPLHPLSKAKLFDSSTGLPRLAVLKEHLGKEGRIAMDAAMILITRASELLHSEPNLLELKYPITVCGDVHGECYHKLCCMNQTMRAPPKSIRMYHQLRAQCTATAAFAATGSKCITSSSAGNPQRQLSEHSSVRSNTTFRTDGSVASAVQCAALAPALANTVASCMSSIDPRNQATVLVLADSC
jgi:hypothetical protein